MNGKHDPLWASLGMWDYVRFARQVDGVGVLYYGQPMTVDQQRDEFSRVLAEAIAVGARVDPFFMMFCGMAMVRTKVLNIWHMQALTLQERINAHYG